MSHHEPFWGTNWPHTWLHPPPAPQPAVEMDWFPSTLPGACSKLDPVVAAAASRVVCALISSSSVEPTNDLAKQFGEMWRSFYDSAVGDAE